MSYWQRNPKMWQNTFHLDREKEVQLSSRRVCVHSVSYMRWFFWSRGTLVTSEACRTHARTLPSHAPRQCKCPQVLFLHEVVAFTWQIVMSTLCYGKSLPLYSPTWKIISKNGTCLRGFPDRNSRNQISAIMLNWLESYSGDRIVAVAFSQPSALCHSRASSPARVALRARAESPSSPS